MRLLELRKMRNISQEDVAKVLNVSPNTYGNYENEKTFPSKENLIKVADYFEVSIDYLLGHQSKGVLNDIYTDDQKKAIGLLAQLNEKNLYIIMGMMIGLIREQQTMGA